MLATLTPATSAPPAPPRSAAFPMLAGIGSSSRLSGVARGHRRPRRGAVRERNRISTRSRRRPHAAAPLCLIR